MPRTGRCEVCGDTITVTAARGRLPRFCRRCRAAGRQPSPGLMRGRLAVSCWCESTVVFVPRDDVLAGLTGPCTRPSCRADDRRHRCPRSA